MIDMANKQNLKVPTSSEARRNGKKGGINSGKARREKRDLKKLMELWMETEVAKDKNGEPLTGAELMVAVGS